MEGWRVVAGRGPRQNGKLALGVDWAAGPVRGLVAGLQGGGVGALGRQAVSEGPELPILPMEKFGFSGPVCGDNFPIFAQ